MSPTEVGRPFDWVSVNVIQFPVSFRGSYYAVVFIDYLTKWPEIFATDDQTGLTIVKLLL